MAINDFLPFCPTDTGTNLLSESDYTAAAQRTIGNQPGVASSKLVNKALRQATYITGQVAQYVANVIGVDVLDDATPLKLQAQMNATFRYLNPVITRYASAGSTTHNVTYKFMIVAGNATVGATYTNNSVTYTVTATIAAGLELKATGSGAPTVSGTLTKATGTGDATITFYAVRAPLYLKVRLAGGGGGGSGGGSGSRGAAGAGGASSFGTSLLTAAAGAGGTSAIGDAGGAGGAPTVNAPAIAIVSQNGGDGTGVLTFAAAANGFPCGATGGSNAFGGQGSGGSGNASNAPGRAGQANTGAGGGGGGANNVANAGGGVSGGAGAYIEALLVSTTGSPLASTFAVVVGAGGTAGTAGTSGYAGGAGAVGIVIVEEHYQ